MNARACLFLDTQDAQPSWFPLLYFSKRLTGQQPKSVPHYQLSCEYSIKAISLHFYASVSGIL